MYISTTTNQGYSTGTDETGLINSFYDDLICTWTEILDLFGDLYHLIDDTIKAYILYILNLLWWYIVFHFTCFMIRAPCVFYAIT